MTSPATKEATLLAYFDCFSGISGDMTLGALLDAGCPFEHLRDELAKLPVGGYTLRAEKVSSKGLQGTLLHVDLDPAEPQPHRHLSDVLTIIDGSTLTQPIKDRAGAIFRRLAEAEAQVHGTTVEQVHFHEVGAVDAIVDVVGSVIGLAALEVDRVFASAVPTGSGTVMTAHGLLPVPAPATLALLQSVSAPLRPLDAKTELVTPTGAAILATLAEFRLPPMRLKAIGHGFGQKELPWANCLRLWIGEPDDQSSVSTSAADEHHDEVAVIEANVDDATPEILGSAMARLFAAGALDVYFTPIQMKKNRPAVLLGVIAAPDQAAALAATILRETPTLGVRVTTARRYKALRRSADVQTPWGSVRVKVKEFEQKVTGAPEYDDCFRVATAAGVTVAEVYAAAIAGFRA